VHTGRRLAQLLVMLAVVAAPAIVLRFLCFGDSCEEQTKAGPTSVPFCVLAPEIRDLVGYGYRQGRSADVLTVVGDGSVRGRVPASGPTGAADEWPGLGSEAATRVPIALAGPGMPAARLAPGTGLADVAPTLAQAIRLKWPFPQLRDGEALQAGGEGANERPRLLLLVAWKGAGSEELRLSAGDWPFLRSLMREGAGTLDGRTGSFPIDSTAALATAGTGGLPASHGITGTIIRNDEGALVQAWSPRAPVTIIAGLGDTLDHELAERPMVGLVGTESFDRGAIGGGWYGERDDDDVRIVPADRAPAAAEAMLAAGYGRDATPDLLAVTLDGSPAAMDRATKSIVEAARAATGGSVAVAVVGTGWSPTEAETAASTPGQLQTVNAGEVVKEVERSAGAPVVEAAVPGALFLDQTVLADRSISDGRIVEALGSMTVPGGGPLFADAFPAFAISFARYC
jgi:hypothetical protein